MISDPLAQALLWAYPLSVVSILLFSRIYFHFSKRDKDNAQAKKRNSSHRSLFWEQIVLCALLLASCITHFFFFKNALAEQSHTEVNQALLVSRAINLAVCRANWMEQSSILAVLFFFIAGLAPDPDEAYHAEVSNMLTWVAACAFEIATLVFIYLPNRYPGSELWRVYTTAALLSIIRVIILLLMIITYVILERPLYRGDADETESLLGSEYQNGHANGNASHESYGSTKPSTPQPTTKVFDPQSSTWLNYLAGFKHLFPFIWYVLESY